MTEKTKILASILSRLLTVDIRIWDPGREDLIRDFSRKNCFDPALQPFYRTENLELLLSSARDGCIYELRDVVGTSLILCRFSGSVLLVGPIVRTAFDAEAARSTLIQNHLPASMDASLQLYYTALPLVSLQTFLHTLQACLESLDEQNRVYTYRLLHEFTGSGPVSGMSLPQPEAETCDEIYARYETEDAFIDAIAAGDVERMLSAYNNMGKNIPMQTMDTFIKHGDPLLGLTVVRTLARKAAQSGGLSVIDVDRITQKAVQRTLNAKTNDDRRQVTKEMLLELTEAVHATRQHLDGCSLPVRKCLEYIWQHYAQNIRVSQLCGLTGLSESQLCSLFRKETGQTVTGCIRKLRCEEAARLLQKTVLPVQEISYYVGYPDNNYFVKVFRSIYGVTPTRYRADKQPLPDSQISAGTPPLEGDI
ncbi:MAG: helix-turn-helix transcriptional regulator [Lachnospiraceae bacterium]